MNDRALELTQALNSECFCTGLDEVALRRALECELEQPGLVDLVMERCPHAFAAPPVFVSRAHLARMASVVRAVEAVVALPAYREEVLAGAAPIARHEPGSRSAFFGYDFHVDGDRLGLIEINTNAGGAMLNAVLARAQRACCPALESGVFAQANAQALEQRIVAMFRNEWRLGGHTGPLRRIAIVDEAPQQQYLYPEFLLFQRLFERHGIQSVIADPAELRWRDGALQHERGTIDLVYNRLIDFALATPPSVALREAYLQQAVVVTPHPRAHALYADKRTWRCSATPSASTHLACLRRRRSCCWPIPRTRLVSRQDVHSLWSERRELFFKPTAGYGADDGEAQQRLKFDLRNYAYDGQVQWVAARLYHGQTTNFRTPGGGFAPVYALA